MSETAEIPLEVLTDMKRSLFMLKESKRLLVSAPLDQWLRDRFNEQNEQWPGQRARPFHKLLFRGVPVVVCDQLQGHEYAFVK